MNGSLALRASRAVFIIISLFFGVLAFTPNFAAADTAVVQTRQLLPLGANTCQTFSVTSVEPHVYNGTLQSFDITIADPSYIAITGTVGNTAYDLGSITRWAGNPQGVRIHVDIPTTAVGSGVPVNMTLLSAPAGAPVCVSIISFNVSNTGAVTPVAPIPQPTEGTSSGTGTVPTPTGSVKPVGSTSSSASSTVTSTTSGSSTQPVVAASLGERLARICEDGNAYRLWFILLLIYLIVVATVAFAELWFLEKSVLATVAAILVPLVLLLTFWYFSTYCRAASWIPVAACVIAIVGLFLTFREYESPPPALPTA